MRRSVVPVLGIILALGGCYGGSGANSPNEQKKPSVKGSRLPAGLISSGVYESSDPDDVNCCWIAGTALFPVRLPVGAKRLQITVALPDFPSYKPRPQTMNVTVDGVRRGTYAHLDPGIHMVSVPIQPPAAAREGLVKLDMAYTFVPMEQNISADSRRISVQLKSVVVR